MNYKQEYERWLRSDALSPAEHAELESIAGDEKEIENRFYGPLEFGTAGLRGTMKVGLHQMNIHVIRWATQGFANVIAAESATTAVRRASTSPPATTPRSTTVIRSTGPTAPSCRPSTPTPSPPSWKRSTSSPA